MTMGECIGLSGFALFYVGAVVTVPVGVAVQGAEMCVVAPAYDILWMPYDCYKYIERAPERRIQRERAKSYDLAFNHLDEALNDERYLSPTNTIQRESLGRVLKDKKREDLTSKQAARILAAIRKNPSMLPDLCHVAKQLAVSNADFEWIVNQAVEHKKTLKEGERNPIADAACESRYVTDAQYVKLANAGCSASQIRYSREERDRLRKMKELEIRYSIEGEKRKEEQRLYAERMRRMKEEWKKQADEEYYYITSVERYENMLKNDAMNQLTRHAIEMEILALALFSDHVKFQKSLEYFTDQSLQMCWRRLILQQTRSIRKEYLEELLRRSEIAYDNAEILVGNRALKKAIFTRRELSEKTVLTYYNAAVAANDKYWIRVIIRCPAMPKDVLRKAYLDPKLARLRYVAAMNEKFWSRLNQTVPQEFIVGTAELFNARKQGTMDEELMLVFLDAWLRFSLPQEMPEHWQQCLPRSPTPYYDAVGD